MPNLSIPLAHPQKGQMTMVIIGRRPNDNGGRTIRGRPSLHGHAHLGDGEGFVGVFLHEGGLEGEGSEGLAVDQVDLFFGAADALEGLPEPAAATPSPSPGRCEARNYPARRFILEAEAPPAILSVTLVRQQMHPLFILY